MRDHLIRISIDNVTRYVKGMGPALRHPAMFLIARGPRTTETTSSRKTG
ncbi:hypothetical protein ABIE00_005114 [Arthrobacter sp. OAP107]